MFTGIIKLIGKIEFIDTLTDGLEVLISCKTYDLDMNVGDSISVNGVCSTVVAFNDTQFTVHYLQETLRVTTFHKMVVGDYVNLEPSLTLQTKLSGHYVSGHVDAVGCVKMLKKMDPWGSLTIEFDKKIAPYFIYKGSIAIDGISLTIAELAETELTCHIIPHTFEHTILQYYDIGNNVNIECDMLGKYVLKAIKHGVVGDNNDTL